MTDTVRSLGYLQNVLRDGQPAGSIIPQDVRDAVYTAIAVSSLAAAGNSQGTATILTAQTNVVTTVASGAGVILQSGIVQRVLNRGANVLLVYPPSGANIETNAANAAVSIAVGGAATFAPDQANVNQIYAY